MSSPAQISANRANAQLSTGPRSVEGKAASSRNATKLGIYSEALILPGEDPARLDALSAEYEAHYNPVGPVEIALLETAVRAQWMMRRYAQIETEVLQVRAAEQKDSPHPIGAAYVHDAQHGNALGKVFRRLQAARREWQQAIADLEYLQARRRAEEGSAPKPPLAPADWVRSSTASAAPIPPARQPRPTPQELALRL